MKKINLYIAVIFLFVCLILVLIFGNKETIGLNNYDKNIYSILKNNDYVTVNCIINNKNDFHYMLKSNNIVYNSKEENNLIINNELANTKLTFSCNQVTIIPYQLTEKEIVYEDIIFNNEKIDVICIDVLNQQNIYRNILSNTFTQYDRNNNESFIYFKDSQKEYKPSCIEYQIIENES